MNEKTLSKEALEIIDSYLNFKIDEMSCGIPYYNNKKTGSRISTRVQKGKGSPEEIKQEVRELLIKEGIKNIKFDLKKFLVERNIGIDCSGLAYYILDAECQSLGKGKLKDNISFPFCKGIFRKIKCKLRPEENIDVATLAHNTNSHIVPIEKIEPGDMVTILRENKERNHILIIHKVGYINNIPNIIYYTHSISLPEDGLYGHGIRQEKIELGKQEWNKNYIIRRLHCFS